MGWDDKLELQDGSYSVPDIQDYVKYIKRKITHHSFYSYLH